MNSHVFSPKLKTLAAAIALSFSLFSAQAALAQDRSEIYVGVPLLYGSFQNPTSTDILVYQEAQKFIGTVNSIEGASILYQNPQIGTPIELSAWLLNHDIDAAFLPYPVYVAMENVGLTQLLTPIAAIPSSGSVLVGNAAACADRRPLEEVIGKSLFISGNEYAPNARLLAELIFSQAGTRPQSTFYGETFLQAKTLFKEQLKSADPALFLTDQDEAGTLIADATSTCSVRSGITSPWPSAVLVARSDVSQLTQRSLLDSLDEISNNREKYLASTSKGSKQDESLLARINNFVPPSKDLRELLARPGALLKEKNIDPRAFFDINQLISRMGFWAKTGSIALIMPPTDSRAAYPLGAAAETMNYIDQSPVLSRRTFITGSSGGAMGALLLSLEPNFLDLDERVVTAILDPSKLIHPASRYEMILDIYDWWPVALLVFLVVLAFFFYSPIALWEMSGIGGKRVRNFLVALVVLIFASVLTPPIMIEVAVPIIIGLFGGMLALIFIPLHKKYVRLAGYAGPALVFIVAIATVRGVYSRPALMERLSLESSLRELSSSASGPLMECGQSVGRASFSRCLYDHLQYPLVISTSDLSRDRQVFFYAGTANGTPLEVPRKGYWVDLSSCPENLMDVVEASASFPFVFPPVFVECAGNSYQLTDGGIFSAGTALVAADLGAATAVTFQNEPFSPQSILGVAEQALPIHTMPEYLDSLIHVIVHRNLNSEIQETLPLLRHVIFTPPRKSFILPNYRYFGMKKEGVTYTQIDVYHTGVADAQVPDPDGNFLQISGTRFVPDEFARQVP